MNRPGKHLIGIIFALALAASAVAPKPAAAVEFGIASVAGEASTTAAARHPDLTTRFVLNSVTEGGAVLSGGRVEDVTALLPPGLIGDPTAVPRCSTGAFLAYGNCPVDTQVGLGKVALDEEKNVGVKAFPVFNLELPHPEQEVARFGFYAGFPVFIDVSVRTESDYGVTATVRGAPAQLPIHAAEATFWGDPADPIHDFQRLTTIEAIKECGNGTACKAPGGKRSSGLSPTVFLTNPSACQNQEIAFSVTSYQLPGQIFSASAPMAPITDCDKVPFGASFEMEPTTRQAGAPTGLHTVLRIPQNDDPAQPSTSTLRSAKVTLPAGMTISASAAAGLEACSDEQVRFHQTGPAQCPDASKLGTATVTSPALAGPLHGAIYQRTPQRGHQFRLWLVAEGFGLHIKLPGEVKGDPRTGQLTAEFIDLPQLPVEEVEFNFFGGPRAPLKNPDSCGTYGAGFAFTPWSGGPDATGEAAITIDEGCGVGFSPKVSAGVTRPVAGKFSPLIFTLTREDAEENIDRIEVNLPQGELAKLKGVPLCPDEAAATGACPAGSRIGTVVVAAGAGPNPLWIPQPGGPPTAVYLAGPYEGAPYSLVSVVPAVAGPFDLGTVAVRSPIYIDPETGEASVETELPQVLEGATILYRTVHVVIDRHRFTLNPTDCREMAISTTVTGSHGATAHPRDRFQVDGCRALRFGPQLSLELDGGTERGDYPRLTAVMRTRKKDANIDRVSVALPHSEFLAQQHIGTICTRVRFAAGTCPKRSIYGYAKAWTPLLSKPLEGPVYLRSSDHPLPDLVVALDGQIDIDLVGRIDSHNGGIRTTFESVPDAPVTRFVLRMQGGAKGLLQNSQNICRGVHRADVRMRAQNGRRQASRPPLESSCGRE